MRGASTTPCASVTMATARADEKTKRASQFAPWRERQTLAASSTHAYADHFRISSAVPPGSTESGTKAGELSPSGSSTPCHTAAEDGESRATHAAGSGKSWSAVYPASPVKNHTAFGAFRGPNSSAAAAAASAATTS